MADTVADLLIDRLIEWGVDTIFGFPGDGINGIFEALRTRQKKISFVQVRHEEAAAFAACGYAKYTGRLGVCLATSGPGGIHLLNGLYDAKCDGQPVLAITGHTFHDLIGTHYQQDVDLDKLFMDVAEFNQRIMGPAHVHNMVDEAVKTALARRTVAHLSIPKDIQEWTASNGHRSPGNIKKHSADVFAAAHPLPPQATLERAAALINEGSKVAILAGRGCLDARPEILEVAEKLGAPIIKPLLGKAVVPDDSEYTTGGIGLLGTGPSQEALADCDTLLIAGSGFPYLDFYPKPGKAKGIQIDIDPARIGLRYDVDVGLVGDCRTVLRALIPLVDRKEDRSLLTDSQNRMKDWRKLMQERGTRQDMPMKPQVVAHELNKLLADDAIIATDSGTITCWIARHLSIRGDQMFSCSGNLATMACGLPYAVAAAVAHPDRQVIAFVGDGGLTMLIGELATCAKYKLNVKVVVIKNDELGQIKWEQMVFLGNPEYVCDLHPVDFAAVARGFGIPGFSVEDPAHCAEALRQALETPGPALIQAIVDPNEPPMAPKVTFDQARHLAEALAKGTANRGAIARSIAVDKVRELI